jgi:hypothetical protein
MVAAKHAQVRIGCGAGSAEDRIPPALELAERGELDYMVFECLAERTIARENLSKANDPEAGYTPSMTERVQTVLGACLQRGVRIVSNMGAANPPSAARAVRRIARELGLGDVPCAVVQGDDVSDVVRNRPELRIMETGEPLESILPQMVSANAYLGADMVAAGLETGAPVVITGRVADPSLFLGCAMHHLGWSYDDYPRLAAGTVAGHLLECAAQVTGGYFMYPGRKDVPDLARLGFPFADITADGSVTIGKTDGSGGRVDVATCTEQILYEMHDPAAYITPDCVLDITGTKLRSTGKDRVLVEGARAHPRTPTYKVVVGYFDGYIGEAEVSYGGIDAVARAKIAAECVKERLRLRGFEYLDMRVDLIGMSSLHGLPDERPEPYEVRLRIAGRARDRKAAHALAYEARSLQMNGPGGPGGATDLRVRQVLAVKSVLLERSAVHPRVSVEKAA